MPGFWENKKVLVTGANGFIGGWLCRALVERKANIIGIVHAENKTFELHGIQEKVSIAKTSVCNKEEVNAVFEKARPEICFHLAAKSIESQAEKDKEAAFEVNVNGTRKVLEVAVEKNCAIVFVSSIKTYGSFTEKCFGEENQQKGKGVYAESKILGEKLCKEFSEKGLSVGIARLGNVFGGFDGNFSRIVPNTVKKLLEGKPASIKGLGKSTRDFVYIEDVVEGLLLLGKKTLEQKLKAEVFNFGSGETHPINEVVERLSSIIGSGLEPEFSGKELNSRELLCVEKAEKELGWKARHGLEKALEKTVELYKQTT